MSAQGQAFVRHWSGLREPGQPFVSFHDLEPSGRNTIRLFGTALVNAWGADLTGRDIGDGFAPEVVKLFESIQGHCVDVPCGLWEVGHYITSTGRTIVKEIITLPLILTRSDAVRIARFHFMVDALSPVERITGIQEVMRKTWIDIGYGVPPEPPIIIQAGKYPKARIE
jgi:hypothetical protein